MRILLTDFFGGTAGSTYSVAYLAKGLADSGHTVYAGCRRDSLLYSLIEGTGVRWADVAGSRKWDLGAAKKLSRFVRVHGIQIVNAQASDDRYVSIFARKFFRMHARVIHTRRQRPLSMGGRLQNWFYTTGTDRIIAVSRGVREALVRIGIPDDHISVIPNGTPEDKYKNVNRERVEVLRRQYGIRAGDRVIGCVSRMKNQEQILRALEKIGIPVKAVFVGIQNNAGFESIVSAYTTPHSVFFTGFVPNEEVLAHYPLFSMMVLASIMEGLSQSLLEAMAMGVPVIATNASGNPDLIRHGFNGLLFRDGDIDGLSAEIERLFEDQELRNRIVQNGYRSAFEEFSIENTVKRHEALYLQILATEQPDNRKN